MAALVLLLVEEAEWVILAAVAAALRPGHEPDEEVLADEEASLWTSSGSQLHLPNRPRPTRRPRRLFLLDWASRESDLPVVQRPLQLHGSLFRSPL
jgi:hypothetical protein